jgi:Putative prokaryotic signal transducing protein
MTRLTSVNGAFGAHVLAARLLDEGFDVELRGALNGPYTFSVGDMGRVDVYVPEDQLEEASYVMLVTEVDHVLDDEPRRRRPQPSLRAIVAAVMLVSIVLLLAAGKTVF